MKYRDSAEQSAEYLRLALPLMAKQQAAMHPVSYAVWYDYVSGANAPLRNSVDAYLKDGGVLDESTTYEIFQKHIAEINDDIARQLSEGFQRVMAELALSAEQAGDKATQFGDALGRLSEVLDPASSREGVKAILALTRDMQSSIVTLKGRLAESRNEIEHLRSEIITARTEARTDGLTGLLNRRGFESAIASCLADSATVERGPSLLMIDIDHFKQVNDNYGHVFGDKVLRAVAQILHDNVKGQDTAARYGGEEFVVLLPETPLEGAAKFAEKLRLIVERCRIKRTTDNGAVANIMISLGVASRKAGESASELIARADAALYASKSAGRNRVTLARD